MRKARQFTLRINDRPGLLAEIASALWEKAANIQAFVADVHGREGVLHLVVEKVSVARRTFVEHGWDAAEEEVIVLSLPNKPGSLALLAAKLAKAGVNIRYAYTGPGETRGETNTYLGVSNLTKALKAIR